MSAIRSDEAEFGRDMDKALQEWGRHMEREAVPDRLRKLAARLRDALIAARSTDCQPPEQ